MMYHSRFAYAALVTALLLVLASSAALAVVYVRWDSPNNGPGNDWDHAYHTIQAGLNAAPGGEVWVAGDSEWTCYDCFENAAAAGLHKVP